jgi:hypothetical protein
MNLLKTSSFILKIVAAPSIIPHTIINAAGALLLISLLWTNTTSISKT